MLTANNQNRIAVALAGALIGTVPALAQDNPETDVTFVGSIAGGPNPYGKGVPAYRFANSPALVNPLAAYNPAPSTPSHLCGLATDRDRTRWSAC